MNHLRDSDGITTGRSRPNTPLVQGKQKITVHI